MYWCALYTNTTCAVAWWFVYNSEFMKKKIVIVFRIIENTYLIHKMKIFQEKGLYQHLS